MANGVANGVANRVAIGGLMQRKGKESKIKEKKRKEIKVNNIIYIYVSVLVVVNPT